MTEGVTLPRMNQSSNHLTPPDQAIEVNCPDDTAAVEFAKQFIDGKDIELWQSNRKVAEFEHKPE